MNKIFKVLVVDDSIMSRNKLERVLSKDGYEITSVESGIVALDFLKTNKPDIILLDMIMPGMTGLDVLKSL